MLYQIKQKLSPQSHIVAKYSVKLALITYLGQTWPFISKNPSNEVVSPLPPPFTTGKEAVRMWFLQGKAVLRNTTGVGSRSPKLKIVKNVICV